MPRAQDPHGVPADRQPGKGMGGPIPDFGQYTDFTDTLGRFVEGLLKNIKDWTGIDLYWMLDWSWTTNTILEVIRQANDLTAWLQNPIQRPPNLLTRPSFSSPSAIAAAPDWFWDPVVSLGTLTGPDGLPRTDPQGSARTIADGSVHSMLSNAISERSALTPGQILTCQIHVLVEDGFTASDDQAIRLEVVPSRLGVLQEPVVVAHCGVPEGDPADWISAPVDSKAVFFDVDWVVPETDSPDTVELRVVVSESAGGDVPVRFDGARVAAAGGFLVVLADLFEAGRLYLTDLWNAITAWIEDIFDAEAWTVLKVDTDDAFDVFVRRVKRALHHADADLFHPPTTSDILSGALRSNPWFGWIFEMVDDWLRPVLWASKAATDFSDAVWHAVTVFVSNPLASGAWASLTGAIGTAWNTLVDAVLAAWGSPKTHTDFATPAEATTAALRSNSWFGWLFDMVDDWLEPVLTVGKAVTDFGDTVWHAVTVFAAAPGASGAWTTMVNAINAAWNVLVDAVLAAWGSSKTHADFTNPATATSSALKNNPLTGWLFGSAGLAATLTAFSNALWDYLLGGNRYDGVSRTAWSTAAGAKLETAWRNLWGQITGNSPASAPAPGSAQSLWNGISSNFIQSTLAGIWEPLGNLGSLLTKAKNLINALWDYAFGGSLYNGSAVTAFSSTAGQNVSAAFNALATQFGSTATAKTKGQIGSAVASSVLSGLFPTNTKFQESFAWLGDMFQNGAMPSTPPADPVGDALNQAWEWLSGLMGWQTTTEITQKNAQNFQISALTGGYRNPIWACRYPVGDVSYPEVLNMTMPVYDQVGVPSPKSGNAAWVSGEAPWNTRAASYNVLQNESRGGYIVVSNTAVMDKVGMFGVASAGLNNLFLDLFRVDMGVEAVRIMSVNCTAAISANTGYFEVGIPGGGVLAQAGERYLVRLRNKSSVAGTVQVRCIAGLTGSTSVGMYTTNSTDTDKTTYTWSGVLSLAAAVTPFALFASQGQVATDQLYADDFNRSGIGALWYLQSTNSGQIGISLGTTTYTGSTDGHQHAVYTRPLASDRMWVEGNFYNINSSTPCGLLLNCNRDLSQVVYLYVNNAVARIYTGSATSLTQRATVNTLFNSVPWQFYYDPATNKYTVLKDGKTTGSGWSGLSWTDSGNVVKHGSLYRYGGIRISRASLFYGGNIDNWVLKDWS